MHANGGEGNAGGFSPFGMPGEFVEENSDPVDGTAALKMRLDLLRRRAIIYVSDEYTARIDIFLILSQVIVLLIQGCLHFAQFCCLGFHLGYPSLHR